MIGAEHRLAARPRRRLAGLLASHRRGEPVPCRSEAELAASVADETVVAQYQRAHGVCSRGSAAQTRTAVAARLRAVLADDHIADAWEANLANTPAPDAPSAPG